MTVLRGKEKQPLHVKLLNGALIYTILLLLLVGPMLIFSSGGFGLLTRNPATGATLTIQMVAQGRYIELYRATAGAVAGAEAASALATDTSISPASAESNHASNQQDKHIESQTLRTIPSGQCDATSSDNLAVTQAMLFPSDSPIVWQISPPSVQAVKLQLLAVLKNHSRVRPQLAMSVEISRDFPDEKVRWRVHKCRY